MPQLMPLLCRGLTCNSSTCILIRPRPILGALALTQPSQLRLFARLFFPWCCSAPIQSTKKVLARTPACVFFLLCLRLLHGGAQWCVGVIVSFCSCSAGCDTVTQGIRAAGWQRELVRPQSALQRLAYCCDACTIKRCTRVLCCCAPSALVSTSASCSAVGTHCSCTRPLATSSVTK